MYKIEIREPSYQRKGYCEILFRMTSRQGTTIHIENKDDLLRLKQEIEKWEEVMGDV